MSADFETLVDLASERFGGVVVFANDEFFAPKENLLKQKAAEWRPEEYTDRGKWMDGWETRRRREAGHDFCIVRLGLPGIVRALVVDTTHFRGNYPESCSVAAAYVDGDPTAPQVRWVEIVPRTLLAGDAKNAIATSVPWCFTHVRLDIFPDGGVARLRVHGEVVPDPRRRPPPDAKVDLASLSGGGRVLAVSDSFFGSHHHLLLPDEPRGMHDGWETRRRRGPGHDLAVVQLGVRGTIGEVEVDTTHFKGNAPGQCALDVCDAQGEGSPEGPWAEVLPRTSLAPHTRHVFVEEVRPAGPATHARLSIYPDGGVARLRLWGTVARADRARQGVLFLDVLPPEAAIDVLLDCCDSAEWARRMSEARPFGDEAGLMQKARRIWRALSRADWLEAFSSHPRIGERSATGAAREEQAAALDAGDAMLDTLEEANKAYEARFGHVFIVCAAGRPADDLLAACRVRMANDPDTELKVAAEEQEKITELRLERLVVG